MRHLSTLRYSIRIDPQRPLQEIPAFWASILIPIACAIICSIPIVIDSGALCLSPTCYENFLTSFKLPIGMLSLSIVFGVMIGRFHGSAQRIASYEQNQINNTLRNYFDHRKFFSEWFTVLHAKQIGDLKYISLDSPPKLYGRLFVENTPTAVRTTINFEMVQAAYEFIGSSIHQSLSQVRTLQFARTCDEGYGLTPRELSEELCKAITFASTSIRQYGLSIIPLNEWPEDERLHHMRLLLEEVSKVLCLGFEFSTTQAYERPSLRQDVITFIQGDLICNDIQQAIEQMRSRPTTEQANKLFSRLTSKS